MLYLLDVYIQKLKNIEFASRSENKIYAGLSTQNPSSVLIGDQNQTNIDPWFITGLVDAVPYGSGCFTIGFSRDEKYKIGYQRVAIFKIALHRI